MNISVVAVIVNIVLSILSFILSLISIVTVIITLRQNHKMIENATRPYICVYGQSINPGTPQFYLVVKNFGTSPATMTKFCCSPDLSSCYGFPTKHRDFLADLSKSTFAPGQSKICILEYSKIPDVIDFQLEYFYGKNKYFDRYTIDIKSGSSMPTVKVPTKNEELQTISYTLQEILQKSL